LRALRSFALLERHPRALDERLVAVAGDVRVMHEQVLRALIRGDEPIPLRIVEPLHGSGSHRKTPPSELTNVQRKALRRKPGLVLGHHKDTSAHMRRTWTPTFAPLGGARPRGDSLGGAPPSVLERAEVGVQLVEVEAVESGPVAA